MPRRINCEAWQIRADDKYNPYSGLVVTKSDDGQSYIDPRPKHGYHSQVSSQTPERWLALSPADSPELEEEGEFSVVRRLALNSSMLGLNWPSAAQLGRFRAFNPLTRSETDHALVGIVKADVQRLHARAFLEPASGIVDLGSRRENTPFNQIVSLVLMRPGGRFTFLKSPKDFGHSTKFEVINDPEEGLVVKRFAAAALTRNS